MSPYTLMTHFDQIMKGKNKYNIILRVIAIRTLAVKDLHAKFSENKTITSLTINIMQVHIQYLKVLKKILFLYI